MYSIMSFLIFIAIQIAISSQQKDSIETVTYPGIGTFSAFDFNRITPLLPQSPQDIEPTFLLFTTRKSHVELKFNDSKNVEESPFDGSKQTKVIVHGWSENVSSDARWMHKMKDAILKYEDVNVILVDWSTGAEALYDQAVVNTRVIGVMLGLQIELLGKLKGTNPSDFHVIGHSLGAHVCGYAGKHLNGTLGRITGLDPAGPQFEGFVPEARLWNTDAQFVDSIHTDARPLWQLLGYGMYETCSHVDIYPNGGKYQPGCDTDRWLDDSDNQTHYLLSCFHHRSVYFFIDSYNPTNPQPKAYQCDNYDDFLEGKCTDCGENGEKCVLLGPEAIEYTNRVPNFNQSVVNGKYGKRFFMITGQHRPKLLEGYQYIVHLNFGSLNFEQKALIQVTDMKLTFVDNHGREEKFQFNENSTLRSLFKDNSSIIHSGVMKQIDSSSLELIKFKWEFKNCLDRQVNRWSNLNLERIQVIVLTSSNRAIESQSEKIQFCIQEDEIGRKTRSLFERC